MLMNKSCSMTVVKLYLYNYVCNVYTEIMHYIIVMCFVRDLNYNNMEIDVITVSL